MAHQMEKEKVAIYSYGLRSVRREDPQITRVGQTSPS